MAMSHLKMDIDCGVSAQSLDTPDETSRTCHGRKRSLAFVTGNAAIPIMPEVAF